MTVIGETGARHRIVHAEGGVLDVDRLGTGQRGIQYLEVVPGVRRGLLVGQSEHVVNDPVMERSDPQHESSSGRGMHRHGVTSQGDGVLGMQWRKCFGGYGFARRGPAAEAAVAGRGSRH
jgi:hypothetical protein